MVTNCKTISNFYPWDIALVVKSCFFRINESSNEHYFCEHYMIRTSDFALYTITCSFKMSFVPFFNRGFVWFANDDWSFMLMVSEQELCILVLTSNDFSVSRKQRQPPECFVRKGAITKLKISVGRQLIGFGWIIHRRLMARSWYLHIEKETS